MSSPKSSKLPDLSAPCAARAARPPYRPMHARVAASHADQPIDSPASPPDTQPEPTAEPHASRPIGILRLPQLERRIGLRRSSIYARLSPSNPQYYDPTFPRPVSLGSPMCHRRSAVGWLEHEVEAWLAQRSAARSGA
jgi:prophage regulatory protein